MLQQEKFLIRAVHTTGHPCNVKENMINQIRLLFPLLYAPVQMLTYPSLVLSFVDMGQHGNHDWFAAPYATKTAKHYVY